MQQPLSYTILPSSALSLNQEQNKNMQTTLPCRSFFHNAFKHMHTRMETFSPRNPAHKKNTVKSLRHVVRYTQLRLLPYPRSWRRNSFHLNKNEPGLAALINPLSLSSPLACSK
ncbi:unnamed protein product, partial [Ectocarpus sp. 12 AP-2014]